MGIALRWLPLSNLARQSTHFWRLSLEMGSRVRSCALTPSPTLGNGAHFAP